MKSKHFERFRFTLIAFFVIGIGLFLFFKYPLVGELSKALPEDSATKILERYGSFDSSKKLFVLVRGFEPQSLERAQEIAQKLASLKEVESVLFDLGNMDPVATEYLGRNWFYLSDFNATALGAQEVHQRLSALAESMMQSGAYVSLDRHDPLKLFSTPSLMMGAQSEGRLIVPDHGYCIIASVRPSVSDMEGSQRLYDEVHGTLDRYGDQITLFSPNFYSVENSRYIHNDVQNITLITIVILIGVYFFLLRNKMMLFFSITTLFLSALVSVLLLNALFDDVSILVIAFGAGVATIAEDYLFMLFLNDDYQKKRFNWSVLWGFVATQTGLLSLTFIDFPLLAQLALFASISLAISYLIFAFVFPRLEFYQEYTPNEKWIKALLKWQKIPPVAVMAISVALLAIFVPKLQFDSNFRHLDYQNQPLLSAEQLFEKGLGEERLPVLIYGKSIDEVLAHAEKLKNVAPRSYSIANVALSQSSAAKRADTLSLYDFESLRSMLEKSGRDVGFREGMFSDAYRSLEGLEPYSLDSKGLYPLGIEIVKTDDNRYMSLGFIEHDDMSKVNALDFIDIVDGRELLSHSASNALSSFGLFLGIAFVLLVLIIVVVTRSDALYALNFLLFPVAVIVTLLVIIGSYNLMHLFALFLMMVYGIDYGIYLARAQSTASMRAVIYSCITTFAGFGILVLSDVPAVDSIGVVTIAGLGAILLLFFQKGASCRV